MPDGKGSENEAESSRLSSFGQGASARFLVSACFQELFFYSFAISH
jgi:hypothetical protein